MALVVKHTFLEYRLEASTHGNIGAEEVSGMKSSCRHRSRAFSDSEIECGKTVSLYSSLESCETDSTSVETLSDAIETSSSSASSVGEDSAEAIIDFPYSPEPTSRDVLSRSPDYAGAVGEAWPHSLDKQQNREARTLEERVLELNKEAAELMARARKAEEEAQQLRQKAVAPWSQSIGDTGVQMPVPVPVQMVQWVPVPVSYFTTAAPDTINKDITSNHIAQTTPPCQTRHRQHNKTKANASRSARTTLMLRNIPNNFSRDMLCDLLDHEGFTGCYDFVYLPVDFHRLAGLGYVFVNFATTESAERAKQHFQGFDRWGVTSHKICDCSWGEPLQGLDAHIDRYRNSPVMHEDVPEQYKPVYLKNGVRQPFPVPTKRIRPPRIKRGGIPGMMPDFSAVASTA